MIEYDRKRLGIVLKAARKKAEYTQAEAAKKLGYSTSQFISNIERGVSVAPLSTLAKMAKLYGLKSERIVDVLLAGQSELLMKKLKSK